MKYGILMFPTRHPVDVAVVARQAEALGFAFPLGGGASNHAGAQCLALPWLP